MNDPLMHESCQQFQVSLLRRLRAGTVAFLSEMEQAHVVACGDCRALLDEEQALEELLDTDRELTLSPASTQRLVQRLHSRLDDAIWAMLDHDEIPPPPPDLSDRVLAGLRDSAGLEAVDVPRPMATQWMRAALLAAAAVLLLWFAPWRQGQNPSLTETSHEALMAGLSPDDVELLDWLDVLEQWDALHEMAPIEADTLAALKAGDLLLLDFGEAN